MSIRRSQPEFITQEYPEVYMISMSDDEKSQSFKNLVLPSWEKFGVKVNHFEAITPKDFSKYNNTPIGYGLNGYKNSTKVGTANRKFTPTEKAIWFSAYECWKMCVKENKAFIFIEHDCELLKLPPINLLRDNEMILLCNWRGKRANPMTGYYLTPPIAKMLIEMLELPTHYNVDAWVQEMAINVGRFDTSYMRVVKWEDEEGRQISTIDHRVEKIDQKYLDFKG